MGAEVRSKKIIYPQLSYRVVGVLYDVWSEIGWSHKERYIQKAVAVALEHKNIPFKEQVSVDLKYKDSKIGVYFLDFLVDEKIVLELKRRQYFSQHDIKQILSYLKSTKLKLGILAHFTKDGVRTKRILNTY